MLFLAAHPLWFPWVLRPLVARVGISYSTVAREGYWRLKLVGVRWQSGRTVVEAGEVRMDGPLLWLGGRQGATAGGGGAPQVEVNEWRLRVVPRAEGSLPTGRGPRSMSEVLDLLERVRPAISRWLRRADVGEGRLELGEVVGEIRVTSARWQAGRVTASAASSRLGVSAEVEAELPVAGRGMLRVDGGGRWGRVEAAVVRTNGDWGLEGRWEGWRNRLPVEAQWGRAGWWPREARVISSSVELGAETLGLEGYEPVRGEVSLVWREGRFTVEATGHAEPSMPEPVWQAPVEFEVRAAGDLAGVRVEAMRVVAPWLRAELRRPAELSRAAPWVVGPIELSVEADLARVPGSPMTGAVTGRMAVSPSLAGKPRTRFELRGESWRWRDWEARAVELGGALEWPRLELERGEWVIPGGGVLSLAGAADLKTRELVGVQWSLRGDWVQRWLPRGWEVTNLVASGVLRGPVTNLAHGGRVIAGNVRVPGLKRLEAVVGWEGEGWTLRGCEVTATAGGTRIDVNGGLEVGRPPRSAWGGRLDAVRWSRGGQEIYRLARPAAVGVRRGEGGWEVTVGEVALGSAERELVLAGEWLGLSRGRLRVSARGVASRDVEDLLERRLPAVAIETGRVEGAWDGGVAEWSGQVAGSWEAPGAVAVGVRGEFRGGAQGVQVDGVRVTVGGGDWLEGRVTVPLVVEPGGSRRVRWEESARWAGQVRVGSNETVRDRVEQSAGVRLEGAEWVLGMSGQWSNPVVRVEGTVGSLGRAAQGGRGWPRLESAVVKGELDRRAVRVAAGSVRVEGQLVEVAGEVPWPGWAVGRWSAEDWQRSLAAARVRVRAGEAVVDPFARYLPRFLAAQGRLAGEVEWRSGEVTGEISMAGAATVPLGFLTPARDIAARLVFGGRSVRLERGEARVGGQLVQVTGSGELAPDGGLRFDLSVRGTNVPVVRRRGLLLRSDVDLRLVRTNDGPATLRGGVRVHDSLLVEDLGLLVPGPSGPPEQRPPYFQVRSLPYAEWRLDVAVEGERAVRVYSPIFQGPVGAGLRLQGTLGEPGVVGELRARSGRVLFPFGNLNVEQAAVLVGSGDGTEPRLEVRASALNYGYRIQMDVSGTVREPGVIFSSTPPLSSQEILLLLTAGSVPQGKVSYSTQEKVGRFGLILGRDFLSRLGFSDATSDRLEFRTGEYVSEEGRPTQQVEYRLSERWSAYGEYDRFGGINAGLKFRVLSR